MDRENERFEDRLLDASLSLYASDAPRAGLESRVLARVRAARRAERFRVWAWAGALTAAVVLALTLRIPWRPPPPVKTARIAIGSYLPPVAARVTAPTRELRARPGRARRAQPAERRPEQFPTPAPLSEQEKLLLVYVKETPKSVLAAAPTNTEKDLEIPALSIAALQIKDLPRSDGTD
jgi:hypothetical protein